MPPSRSQRQQKYSSELADRKGRDKRERVHATEIGLAVWHIHRAPHQARSESCNNPVRGVLSDRATMQGAEAEHHGSNDDEHGAGEDLCDITRTGALQFAEEHTAPQEPDQRVGVPKRKRHRQTDIANGKNGECIGHGPESTGEQSPYDQVLFLTEVGEDVGCALEQRGKRPARGEHACNHAERNSERGEPGVHQLGGSFRGAEPNACGQPADHAQAVQGKPAAFQFSPIRGHQRCGLTNTLVQPDKQGDSGDEHAERNKEVAVGHNCFGLLRKGGRWWEVQEIPVRGLVGEVIAYACGLKLPASSHPCQRYAPRFRWQPTGGTLAAGAVYGADGSEAWPMHNLLFWRMLVRAVASAFCLGSVLVTAQSFTPVREQKNLSPAALTKLHTLETLSALPAGNWRFHAGDIAHGESPTVDDSSWPVAAPKSKASRDAVWYRREITIPRTVDGYDITGSRITFQLQADANGPMPQIIYFNGRRVALGDDLEPITLVEPAREGDKILVAVKLLHTVDQKTFAGVFMHIEPPVNSHRPDPNDVRVQCIAAANLLPALATPRKDLLPRVEAAVAAISTDALARKDQAGFDASLRKAQGILDELHPVLAQAHITEDGNAHIDAAWLWPRSETIDVVRRTFTTALQLMDEYPNYVFTQSAAQYSAWVADKYPDMNAQIKKRIQEGRWEIVGGMWVEPDLNIPDGESLVRQLLVGQRFFQKEYGVTARIGWNPDSFGYNWQLPQIYKRSGVDYFVTQKMHWNDTNQLPFRLFWWQSPDGSKVLTYFPTDYVHGVMSPTRTSADFAESADRNPGTTHLLDLYGVGDHGGGPTRAMLDDADHWMAASRKGEALPAIKYGTAQSYFDDVESHLSTNSPSWDYEKLAKGWTAPAATGKDALGLPTWNDELYFEYHRGIFTTQAAHKRNIRQGEAKTLDAEKLASFAWLQGQTYPASELTENWKKITFNQFHDLAAGSGIGVIYRDAQEDFTEVFRSDREVTDAALHRLGASVNTTVKAGVPVLVANTMAWPRSEVAQMTVQLPEAGDHVTVIGPKGPLLSQVVATEAATHTFTVLARAEDVPALGYAVLNVVEEGKSGGKRGNADLKLQDEGSAFVLSNAHLQATVDKRTGCVSSLKLGNGGKEFLAPKGCGNELQTYVDTPKNYDAWNIDPGTLDGKMTPISGVDSIAVVSDGPLRKTVRIKRSWGQSHFTQDVSLDAGADSLRVDNDVDWHETHVLLKAAFPLAASGPKASFEIPYGAIERPTTRSNSFEKAKFEVPALRWADLGDEQQGVSILNDSKYGYDALGNTLRLTLLRSSTWPDPEADRGSQHFAYSIYPHTGTWKTADTVRRGYEINDPLLAAAVFPHAGTMPASHSWGSVEEKNVVLTAVKKAEDADALIFRMYEWAGTPTTVHLHVPTGATLATETNLMEKPEPTKLGLSGDVVSVSIKPYEILTVSVSYPHSGSNNTAGTLSAKAAANR